MTSKTRQSKSDSIRLFVGLYPPLEVAESLLSLVNDITDLPPLRLTRIEQVHLTIQFIGDVRLSNLDHMIESVQRAKKGLHSFSLQPANLITLPNHGPPPRLIAAETNAPADLLELQTRLTRRFARNPRSQPGNRFRPHMTLCRFKPGEPRPSPIIRVIDSIPEFQVTNFRLMKSMLQKGGAIHTEVASCFLRDD